jgi:hypothetical protein
MRGRSLRVDVSPETHVLLRTAAAIQDRSVADLLREVLAANLDRMTRATTTLPEQPDAGDERPATGSRRTPAGRV